MAGPDEELLPPRRADALSGALMAGFALAYVLQASLPVVAPVLRAGHGLSASRVGLLMSAFLFAYAIVQIPAGLAAARAPRSSLALGYVAMLSGALLFAWSSGFTGFAVARVLQGAGGGVMLPTAGVLLVRLLPRRRLGRGWAIFGMGSGMGTLVAMVGLSRFDGADHRPVFLAGAAIGLALTVLTFIVPEIRRDLGDKRTRRAFPPLWPGLVGLMLDPKAGLLCLVNVAGIGVSVGVVTWMPSFLNEARGATPTLAASLTAVYAASQLLTAPVAAAASERMRPTTLMGLSLAALVALLALVPLLPSMWGGVAAVMGVGVATMLLFPPSFALIPTLVESGVVGLATGYLNAVGFVGAMLAPWLFGLILDRGWGYGAGFALLAGFAALGLLAVWMLMSARFKTKP